MPKPTDWSSTTINSSNWLGSRANETITAGTAIGLLLSLTQGQSIDTPVFNFATDYTPGTVNASNWGGEDATGDTFIFENGDTFLFEDGSTYIYE